MKAVLEVLYCKIQNLQNQKGLLGFLAKDLASGTNHLFVLTSEKISKIVQFLPNERNLAWLA